MKSKTMEEPTENNTIGKPYNEWIEFSRDSLKEDFIKINIESFDNFCLDKYKEEVGE